MRMRRLRLGDADALDELVAVYWPALVRYAAELIGSHDGAEDLAQEAFIAIWQQRASWQGRGSPRAYLYGIVRKLALKEHRRGGVRQRLSRWIALDARRPLTPADTAQRAELKQAFAAALAALPARRREAFVLIRYHGFSLQDAAALMQIAPQTVANQVSAAVADLRIALQHFS